MTEQPVPVGLSTASVWPLKAGAGFELAAELGYDGVEVMVWADPVSQDVSALRRWSRRTGMPVLSVHSPSLLITQRVWSPEPVCHVEVGAFTPCTRRAGPIAGSAAGRVGEDDPALRIEGHQVVAAATPSCRCANAISIATCLSDSSILSEPWPAS